MKGDFGGAPFSGGWPVQGKHSKAAQVRQRSGDISVSLGVSTTGRLSGAQPLGLVVASSGAGCASLRPLVQRNTDSSAHLAAAGLLRVRACPRPSHARYESAARQH